MGGKALEQYGIHTKRLVASDFRALCDEVVQAFSRHFPGVRITPIPSYAEKADFGDLDVLVEREAFVALGGVEKLEDWVREVAFSRAQDRNGPVTSLEWRHDANEEFGFQVDFITSPAAEFEASLHYFSYNDLGNLVGRIAHKMGLIYGHKGYSCRFVMRAMSSTD